MASENAASTATQLSTEDDGSIFSRRSRRQLGIWAAGAGFMLFSAAITRRAIARRNNWTRPLYFYNNMDPHLPPINGPLEALEALSVATINAVSFGILLTGGLFWSFDISSVEELRRRTRDRLGYEKAVAAEQKEGGGVTQEEWLISVVVDEEEQKNKPLRNTLSQVKDKAARSAETDAPLDRDVATHRTGGPLDQLGQQTAKSVSETTKSWSAWWSGK